MEDARIVELYWERDEAAIAESSAKYGGYCYQIAFRILALREDAEECVNDAYLGAWNAIPPSRPSPLLPYIAKIVRNVSLNAYWKKAAAKRNSRYTVALEELEACFADSKTVETEIEAREFARILGAFLDTLSLENRVIFLRRYWFADGYREIAALVGLSEKAVSVRLTRIRGKMRRYLQEREVFL